MIQKTIFLIFLLQECPFIICMRPDTSDPRIWDVETSTQHFSTSKENHAMDTITTNVPFAIRSKRTTQQDETRLTRTEIPAFTPSPNLENSTEALKSTSHFELTLKACCGSQCVAFDNLMSMVGLQCCGDTPMNAFEKICCNSQVHLRHAGAKYFDRCCGDRPYAWDQVCCRGKVYDGVPQASCCGDVPYSIYDRTSICCGDHLHKIPPGTGSAVCCGENMYDDRAGTHFCCGDRLYSRLSHNGCCHPFPGMAVEYPSANAVVSQSSSSTSPFAHTSAQTIEKVNVDRRFQILDKSLHKQAEGYNSSSQLCCDRVYDKKEFDFCCYVADVNAKHWTPPIPKPYSSKTHCCDGMAVLELDPKKNCIKT